MLNEVRELRLGVIIELPEPYFSELREYRWSFGDQMAKIIPPHITIVSSTIVSSLEKVLDHLYKVAKTFSPFTIELKGVASFRPVSSVVYLQLAQGEQECRILAEAMNFGLLKVEPEYPYHPHVTVVHDLPEPKLDEAEKMLHDYHAEFQVSKLGIFQHQEEGMWHIVEELKLGAS